MTSAKAIVSGIFAALTAGISALMVVLVGDLTLADITQAQWLTVIGAVVAAGGSSFGLVYSVTNAPAKAVS